MYHLNDVVVTYLNVRIGRVAGELWPVEESEASGSVCQQVSFLSLSNHGGTDNVKQFSTLFMSK